MSIHARVFLVDDDPSARNGLARFLRTAGHDVEDFESATDFLSDFQPTATGCVVLDARMPGLSFDELDSELKSRGIHLPLIFVTADDDPETRKKALDLKASGFFRKPVDGAALLDAIEWALNGEAGDIEKAEGE